MTINNKVCIATIVFVLDHVKSKILDNNNSNSNNNDNNDKINKNNDNENNDSQSNNSNASNIDDNKSFSDDDCHNSFG